MADDAAAREAAQDDHNQQQQPQPENDEAGQQQPLKSSATSSKRKAKPNPKQRRRAGGGAQYGGSVLGRAVRQDEDNRQRETGWDRWESDQDRRLRRLQAPLRLPPATPRAADMSSSTNPSPRTTGAAADVNTSADAEAKGPSSARASPRDAPPSSRKNRAGVVVPPPPPPGNEPGPSPAALAMLREKMPIAAPTYVEECRSAAREWLRLASGEKAGSPPTKGGPGAASRDVFVIPVTHDGKFPPLPEKRTAPGASSISPRVERGFPVTHNPRGTASGKRHKGDHAAGGADEQPHEEQPQQSQQNDAAAASNATPPTVASAE